MGYGTIVGGKKAARRVVAFALIGVLCWLGLGLAWADGRGGHASASEFYLSLSAAAVFPFTLRTTSPVLSPATITTKPGADIGAALGYRSGNLRIEGGVGYGRFDADSIRFAEGGGALSGRFDLWEAMLSVFYDLPTGSLLRPYVGAGLGVARFRAQDVTLSGFPPTTGSNTLLAPKVMLGLSYPVADGWRLVLGYRFMQLPEQDFETGGAPLRGERIRSHGLQFGAQAAF